jgi:hypothetical protein
MGGGTEARARILIDASGDLWIEDGRSGMWLCLTDHGALDALRYNVLELTREQLEDRSGPVREVVGG